MNDANDGPLPGTQPPPNPGHNVGIGAVIRESMDEIDQIDADRKTLNAQKQLVRARLKEQGISLPAFDAAMKRRRLDEKPDVAAKYDHSYKLVCEAIGLQLDLPLPDESGDGAGGQAPPVTH